jgi:hypothetical protein
MSRRAFLQSFSTIFAGMTLPVIAKAQLPKGNLLQTSPIAGFQYHQGEAIWAQLSQGATLQLIREPQNQYDTRAVRIDFQGQKLGYLPKLDNAAVSQLLDRSEQVQAFVSGLKMSDDPWQRVGVEVRWMI